MSEYCSGLTFGQCCMMDKERIKHALKGELMTDEDDSGFIYSKASREECERYILSAYDNVVFHAKDAMDTGRALERLMESKGLKIGETITMSEFMRFSNEARTEYDDYVYEHEADDYEGG